MDRIYVMQLVRSFQVGEISRRTFLRRATAAVGSMSAASLLLAACQPISGTPRPVVESAPSGEGVGSADTNMTTEAGLAAGAVEYRRPRRRNADRILGAPRGRRRVSGRHRVAGMVGAQRAHHGRHPPHRQ